MTDTAGLHVSELDCDSLRGVDLTVAPGEVVCLSGPSGAGKTRLLRAIADLDAHGGEVRLNGTEQRRCPADRWRARVMLVPAESRWWAERVADHFRGRPDPGSLAALGLPPEAADWEVGRLSSGERQRLALLRALERRPDALLLDEPTANLDEEAVYRVESWLLDLIRRWRLPVLWVAHDREQIARVADRHLRIRDGVLQEASCR